MVQNRDIPFGEPANGSTLPAIQRVSDERSETERGGCMGHSVARVLRVQRVLPAFGRRVQRVVVSPCGR